jgi:uncharacterized protein with PQ loop repeat
MASVLGIAAATWGVLMAVAPALQIRRMIIRRSSADLSLGYFAILLPGFALWVGYGLARGDWPIVVPNAIAFTVGAVTVVAAIVLRHRTEPSARRAPTDGIGGAR